MKYSVIVPVYKTEKYIRECVDSILGQKYDDIEVILVDDGSPDGCPAIVDEYAEKDRRVVAVHKKNGGLVSARKAGAAVATGDYIFNIDSDDKITDDLIIHISQVIEKDLPDVVLFGYTLFNDKEPSGATGCSYLKPGVYKDEKIKEIISTYMYDKNRLGMNGGSIMFNICCKVVKREIYVKCQNMVSDKIVSGEDTMFTMNLLRNITSLAITEHFGYLYRQNPTSIEHTVSPRDLENLATVFGAMEAVAKEEPLYRDQMYVYALQRIWVLTIRAAISAKSYSEFKEYVKNPFYKKMNEKIQIAVVSKKRQVEKLVITAVKKKWFLLIYMLGKTWFKNKDMM